MSERDREYDRFGPWALEITDEDPLPPAYQPYAARVDDALISVKVPRRIARRDASAGMDLYDYVVSLFDDDLLILHRTDADVSSHSFRYRDISYVRLRDNLLRGSLLLGVSKTPYELPFNTVSNELMNRLTEMIRIRYLAPDAVRRSVTPVARSDTLSYYFERLLKRERDRDPALQPLAAQPETSLGALDQDLLRRVFFGVVDKRLLESLHMSDGRELRVFDRGSAFAYRWQTIYGRDETWIPLANITAVDRADDAGLALLTLDTSAGPRRWRFKADNATLEHYLESLTRQTAARH